MLLGQQGQRQEEPLHGTSRCGKQPSCTRGAGGIQPSSQLMASFTGRTGTIKGAAVLCMELSIPTKKLQPQVTRIEREMAMRGRAEKSRMGWRILRAHLGKAAEIEAALNSSNTRQHRVLMVLTPGVTITHVSLGMGWRAVTGSQEHQELPAPNQVLVPRRNWWLQGERGRSRLLWVPTAKKELQSCQERCLDFSLGIEKLSKLKETPILKK